ncbi:MAG: AAA family ATPase [Bradyrhizobium sp.]
MAGDDPIWKAWGPDPAAEGVPLVLRPARLPAPETIPPRQWLYGTSLLRGFVTVLVAPGGTGKTVYAMTVAVSLASGQSILGDHLFDSVVVAILNLEDPLEEMERRLAAILMRHYINDNNVQGRIFLHSGQDRPVTMAAPSPDGFDIIYPDEQALTRELIEHHIGLLVVDPFAESHSLVENSNPDMVKAAAAWRRVARATGCAVLLIHHVRKGPATDIEAARGGKALTDSARVGLLLSTMTEDEAGKFEIAPADRWQYVRLDDAKANLAPRADKASWYQLQSVPLGNGTADYPNGDHVAAMVRWLPPSVWKFSVVDANAALDRIAAGPAPGILYFARRGGRSTRNWVGQVLVEVMGISPDAAATVVGEWLRNGVLITAEFTDPEQRKSRLGVQVVDARRPGTEHSG